ELEVVVETRPRRHLHAVISPELTERFLGGGHDFGRYETAEPNDNMRDTTRSGEWRCGCLIRFMQKHIRSPLIHDSANIGEHRWCEHRREHQRPCNHPTIARLRGKEPLEKIRTGQHSHASGRLGAIKPRGSRPEPE